HRRPINRINAEVRKINYGRRRQASPAQAQSVRRGVDSAWRIYADPRHLHPYHVKARQLTHWSWWETTLNTSTIRKICRTLPSRFAFRRARDGRQPTRCPSTVFEFRLPSTFTRRPRVSVDSQSTFTRRHRVSVDSESNSTPHVTVFVPVGVARKRGHDGVRRASTRCRRAASPFNG